MISENIIFLNKPYKKYGYTPKIDVYNYFWYGYKRVVANA